MCAHRTGRQVRKVCVCAGLMVRTHTVCLSLTLLLSPKHAREITKLRNHTQKKGDSNPMMWEKGSCFISVHFYPSVVSSLSRSKSGAKGTTVSIAVIWYSSVTGAIYAVILDRLITAMGWLTGGLVFVLGTAVSAPFVIRGLRLFYRWTKGKWPWLLGEED